jgi:hypothetical protein
LPFTTKRSADLKIFDKPADRLPFTFTSFRLAISGTKMRPSMVAAGCRNVRNARKVGHV